MPFHLTDTEWVMIVVAAIYLFECACWIPREAVCLSSLLGRFRALQSPPFMGNERRKLVMGNPSPLARSFICEPWPVAVSPEGICLLEEVRLPSVGKPPQHIAFDRGELVIEAEGKAIIAGGGLMGVCVSKDVAQSLAEVLREVAAASPAERGELIGKHLDRWTDHEAVAQRNAELKRTVAPLRVSGVMLFALAFIIGPVLYYVPPYLPVSVTLTYLLVLFSTWMLTIWDCGSCRKQLFGEKFSERFRHVGMLFLSPAAAMRSSEVLLRGGLAAYHPLAVAAALCAKERFTDLARPMLLALEHPRPDEQPRDTAAGHIDEWFRKKLAKRLYSLVRRMELDPQELLRPGEPSFDSRSYCPRCHNQYVFAEGTCVDCGGLALVAYPEKQ